jgi:hypothetical protein
MTRQRLFLRCCFYALLSLALVFPLISLALSSSGGFRFVCLLLGVLPCFTFVRVIFDTIRDLSSSPVNITGRVSGKQRTRANHMHNRAATDHSYLMIGADRFEVDSSDLDALNEGDLVTLTYWPNNRITVSVERVSCERKGQPLSVDPAWLTSNVVALAKTIYDEQSFDRLPILADALEDAGCDNAEVLNHCRQPGEHVKGCWVVDLVLGKE